MRWKYICVFWIDILESPRKELWRINGTGWRVKRKRRFIYLRKLTTPTCHGTTINSAPDGSNFLSRPCVYNIPRYRLMHSIAVISFRGLRVPFTLTLSFQLHSSPEVRAYPWFSPGIDRLWKADCRVWNFHLTTNWANLARIRDATKLHIHVTKDG